MNGVKYWSKPVPSHFLWFWVRSVLAQIGKIFRLTQDRLIINYKRHDSINLHFIAWCIAYQSNQSLIFLLLIYCIYTVFTVYCVEGAAAESSLYPWLGRMDPMSATLMESPKGELKGYLGCKEGLQTE